MRYVLLIHWDEKAAASEGFRSEEAEIAEHRKYIESLVAAGKMRDGLRLQVEAKAACVRVRDGKRLLTDGPYAEAKEALGGLYILECDSMEDALDWASRCPSARHGTIEVRPEWPT